MMYKIEKEQNASTIPRTVYVVYERPFVCVEWQADIAFVSRAAAKDRIKHLRTFKTKIDWSVTYYQGDAG